MVWEQNSQIIVMLTNLKEKEKVKIIYVRNFIKHNMVLSSYTRNGWRPRILGRQNVCLRTNVTQSTSQKRFIEYIFVSSSNARKDIAESVPPSDTPLPPPLPSYLSGNWIGKHNGENCHQRRTDVNTGETFCRYYSIQWLILSNWNIKAKNYFPVSGTLTKLFTFLINTPEIVRRTST